jgi:ABC-type nitrate/sulfonate/bicarbonate transport system permease component
MLRTVERCSGLLITVLGVGLWQLLTSREIVDFDYLPPPSDIAGHLPELLADDRFLQSAGHTVSMVALGWSAAVLAGVLGALLLSEYPRVCRWATGLIELLRPLPIVALVPVATLLWGLTERAELALVFYAALWPTLINTLSAAERVHRRRHEVANILGASRLRKVWSIVLPSTAPSIVAGLRVSVSLAVVIAIVTEMIAIPEGLGYQIVTHQQALQPEAMYLSVAAVVTLGVVANLIVIGGGRLLSPLERVKGA